MCTDAPLEPRLAATARMARALLAAMHCLHIHMGRAMLKLYRSSTWSGGAHSQLGISKITAPHVLVAAALCEREQPPRGHRHLV